MSEIVSTGLIPTDTLLSAIAACGFASHAFFLAEQLPMHLVTPRERQHLLVFTTLANSPAPDAYTSGRVFQDDRELRWERQGNNLRAVYLGPQEPGVALQAYSFKESSALANLTKRTEPASYYLFGERLRLEDLEKLDKVAQPGDFAVIRIPRILRYPVADTTHRYARLLVCEYEDATGRIALFRFQRLETLEK